MPVLSVSDARLIKEARAAASSLISGFLVPVVSPTQAPRIQTASPAFLFRLRQDRTAGTNRLSAAFTSHETYRVIAHHLAYGLHGTTDLPGDAEQYGLQIGC